jgi:hypothetical protein
MTRNRQWMHQLLTWALAAMALLTIASMLS